MFVWLRVSIFPLVFCISSFLCGMLPHVNYIVHRTGMLQNAVMLEHHSCFHQLPKALQDIHRRHAALADRVNLSTILEGLDQKKRPALLDLYVWRMVVNQEVSHKTAEHILTNLNHLFDGKPMIDDKPIDWNIERKNKLSLIAKLNCGAVREQCAADVDDEYSICLQEFVYGRLNHTTLLAFEGPYMPYQLVEFVAHKKGCRNVKRFDISNPDLVYHEVRNHQFCCE